LVAMRWIVSGQRPWARRFAATRAKLASALAGSPSTSFLAILIARATPLPDGPIKWIAAAGGYPLPRYFAAVLLGGIPYFAVLAWVGHEFPVPPWVLLLIVAVIVLVFVFERWRKRGRPAQG